MPGCEEGFDSVQNRRAVLGFEDLFAQSAAAGDAVREPAGELLHLADAVAMALLASKLAGGSDGRGACGFGGLLDLDLTDEHAEVVADHAVAVVVGGLIVGADAGGFLRGGVLRDLAEDPRVCRRG